MDERCSEAIEDARGVDVSQIRAQLRLAVPDRVRQMVEVANRMIAIRDTARRADHE